MSSGRRIAAGLVLAATAVIAVIVASGDGHQRLRLQMANASGLREGSQVRVGGVPVGKVDSVSIGRGDTVHADLEIDREKVKLGRGASVQVAAVNLLGDKFVALDPGDPTSPLGSGATLPANRVATPTDLDQVLDVLDTDTRTRLAILINEAGTGLAGRRTDFNELLQHLPTSLAAARGVVAELAASNKALRRTVERSDSFVAGLARERRQLERFIDAAAGAATTAAARDDELRVTLRKAPSTLQTLRRFLGDLDATTRPLAPAAREVAASAPVLQSALAQVRPFTRAAEPALDQARAVAPLLTRLGVEASPVIRRAVPTLDSFASFVRTTVPVSDALDKSVDDILALMEGWARAIQARNGVGHVFRGRAIFSTDILRHLMSTVPDKKKKRDTRRGRRPDTTPSLPVEPPSLKAPLKDADVDELLDDLLPQSHGQAPQDAAPLRDLADFLLGP